ncbi:hypothetical protein H0H87_002829 [Tephrocybe sp. NHM501043]|nr:hypothetical protein H0H87_002829 [Tephrocybe sp. NHM501043]
MPTRAQASFPLPLGTSLPQKSSTSATPLDGVEDGIITEPDTCDFRPEAILCSGNATENCLSVPQVEALHKIYKPLYDAEGNLLLPRYDPGSEADSNAQEELSRTIFSISTLIPFGNFKRFYNLISTTLGIPSLDPFYRLFLIPGMQHCVSGPGAGNFGQAGIATNAVNASTHNVLAMVDWVEQGIPPDTITGTADEETEVSLSISSEEHFGWRKLKLYLSGI